MGFLGRQRTEIDLDRLLAGKSLPAESEVADIEQFLRAVRTAYSAEPAPEVQASHLSAIMQEVRSQIESGGSLTPEAGQVSAQSGTSRWRKVLLRGAGASMAVKILGGAVALAGTTGGLAALNALPDPAQERVATAVEAVTPFELPGNPEKEAVQDPGTLQIEEVPPQQVTPTSNPNADFGQSVAEDARDGGVSGPEISQKAREQAERRREEGQAHRPSGVQPGKPEHVPGPPPAAGPPAGNDPGGGPQNGLDRAGQTPAGQRIPQDVPAGPRGPAQPLAP